MISGRFVVRTFWVAALLSTGLVSCASDEEIQSRLAVACAVKKCICEAEDKPVFSAPERRDVLWQDNGNAYCPRGFALAEHVEKDKPLPGGFKLPRYSDPVPCNDTARRCENRESVR